MSHEALVTSIAFDADDNGFPTPSGPTDNPPAARSSFLGAGRGRARIPLESSFASLIGRGAAIGVAQASSSISAEAVIPEEFYRQQQFGR